VNKLSTEEKLEQNTGFLSELEDRNMNWQGNGAKLAVTESRLEGNYHETWLQKSKRRHKAGKCQNYSENNGLNG
jgi:hypothetical protein